MKHSIPVFLNLNGVPSDNPPENGTVYFTFDPQGAWRPSSGDLLSEIETECVRLHEELAAAVFGSWEKYTCRLRFETGILSMAGLNSECSVSCNEFEKLLSELGDMPDLNRFLYLYDCRILVSAIQECTKEALFLQGEFYRALNLDQLFYPEIEEPDGMRFVTSPVVTSITAVLSFIFIRLHSLLDYTTRLAFEVGHIQTDFTSYPRLASRGKLFNDSKQLGFAKIGGTLFEACDVTAEVELYRNRIIHEGFLDDMPKVYKVIEGGRTAEKFILFPDRSPEGRFEKFKNRSRFYSGEDKINLRLPSLLNAFQTRQIATLKLILDRLTSRPSDTGSPPSPGRT